MEGECDFVLLDAENGLLFVEVKGGSLLFDGRQWVRDVRGEHRLLNKDPFAQAQRGMYDIIELVKNQFGRAGDNLPFTYGFAVAFPDCRFEGTLPPSIERELILDAARLREVNDSIRRIFRSFSRADHRALTDRGVESVRAALYPKYQLVPVIWRKIEDQEERLRRLTDDQQRILDILANQSRAAIRGVAGSGKTILALAKAQAIARDGARTLSMPSWSTRARTSTNCGGRASNRSSGIWMTRPATTSSSTRTRTFTSSILACPRSSVSPMYYRKTAGTRSASRRTVPRCSTMSPGPGTARRRGMSLRLCMRARWRMRSGRRVGASDTCACLTWGAQDVAGRCACAGIQQ